MINDKTERVQVKSEKALSKYIAASPCLLQGLKNHVKVKLSIVSCPPVTTVLIKRPDLKYQLGFSVQNGIVSDRLSINYTCFYCFAKYPPLTHV